MTQRYKIIVEYDGRAFSGWQRQEDGITTVQGTLEEAVQKFSGENVTLHVAGRTDAGVHALAMVAHFDIERETSSDEVQGALNYHVKPHAIAVLSVEAAPEDFHARISAKQRHYVYRLLNRRAPSALMPGLVWHVPYALDMQAMQRAANELLGKHDFSTFRAADCQAQSPVKTLDAISFERVGDEIQMRVSARSFLYHQVRNMIGTLVMVGRGAWTHDDFVAAFKAADRARGGPTAPPDGLYFERVDY